MNVEKKSKLHELPYDGELTMSEACKILNEDGRRVPLRSLYAATEYPIKRYRLTVRRQGIKKLTTPRHLMEWLQNCENWK